MDEIWARSYEPNFKRQWNERKHTGSPRRKKMRTTQCAVNVVFIVAYDWWSNIAPRQMSTVVGEAVACTHVTQRARVRFPVGTSFLGEVCRGFSSPVRQMSGSFRPPRSPNIIWPSLSSIIIHYRCLWPDMLTCPKTSNIHTYISEYKSSVMNFNWCYVLCIQKLYHRRTHSWQELD